MADELFRVRSGFVKGVSEPFINSLLDGLLEDGVLSPEERSSILSGNSDKYAIARKLIDTVVPKGDAASRKMIGHIQNDSFLASSLKLNQAGDEGTPPPAAAPLTQTVEWSNRLIPCTESFWREKQMDDHVYPAFKNTLKKRVALMITNIDFTDKRLTRAGATKDEENMNKLLKSLGYEVVKYRNLTGEEIDKALKDFSQHEKLRDTDSVIVVIMSHGKLGEIIGVNYKESSEKADLFCIDNICKHLNTQSCPQLENKPKIIIIQACRGEETGSVLICDSPNQAASHGAQLNPSVSAPEGDGLRFVNEEQDFGFLHSSTPHMLSYRHPVHGSVLIQAVVDVFNTYAHKEHVEDLFRRVTNYCVERLRGQQMQVPTRDRCTLMKKFYLFPGI